MTPVGLRITNFVDFVVLNCSDWTKSALEAETRMVSETIWLGPMDNSKHSIWSRIETSGLRYSELSLTVCDFMPHLTSPLSEWYSLLYPNGSTETITSCREYPSKYLPTYQRGDRFGRNKYLGDLAFSPANALSYLRPFVIQNLRSQD